MERYTYFDGGKWRLKIGDTEYSGDWVERLAAYEETGLEPEELAQPSTNADRIRAMSDEELASMLFAYKECGENCIMSDGKHCYQICDEESTILKWIQQPAEEER